MAKNTAAIRVGRLLEIRADAGYRTVADVDQLFAQVHQAVAALPRSQNVVTVVDWRRCPVMESQASERILQNIMGTNARTERSAALASRNSPVAVLQFMRLIRESGHPQRKMFFHPDELRAWLGAVLTPAEVQRLQEFLAL